MSSSKFGPEFNPPPEGAPDWALSWADMMTLIVVFFVLLASYSNLDVVKYRELTGSLQAALGARDRTLDDPQREGELTAGISSAAAERERRWVEREVESVVREIGGPLQMIHSSEGMRVRIDGKVLFETGQAELRPEAVAMLQRLAPPLRRYPYRLQIEGHTDDVPIATATYPSNWELSAARAANVVRFLIADAAIPPDRLSAVAYADTRPVFSNASEESRARNRRVEFLLSKPPAPTGSGIPDMIPDSITPHLPAPSDP